MDIAAHRAVCHGQRTVVVDVVIHRHAGQTRPCSGVNFQSVTSIPRTARHLQPATGIQINTAHSDHVGILQLQFSAVIDVQFIRRTRTCDTIRYYLILYLQRAGNIQVAPILHLQLHALLQPRCLAAGYGGIVTLHNLIAAGQSGGQG